MSGRLLRLPFYNNLTEGEQGEVISAICSFTTRPVESVGRAV